MRSDVSALALCALMNVATSCAKSADGYYGVTRPRHAPDEAWTNLAGEPETIDPGKSTEQAGGTIVSNIFAGLTQAHPVTLEPLPDIAERWEVSADGLRYVFHLRESRWSDGVPLTAADFQYAWQRVLDPRTGSRYASFLFGLKHAALFNRRALCVRGVGGAGEEELRALLAPIAPIELMTLDSALDAAFVVVGGDERARPMLRERLVRALHERTWQGRTLRVSPMDASQVGVQAQSEHRLVVHLETPLPYFLHITKHPTAMPVPRHVIERLQRQGKNEELWSRPENIASNGAYVLKDAKFRQSMLLERNPRYWDAENVKLSRIRIAMIENYNTTLNMYEAGELDAIGPTSNLPAELLGQLRTRRDFVAAPYLSVHFFWVNTGAAPLDNPLVRRALSLAIDRDSLVTHVTRAGQLPTADIVPSGLGGYAGLRTPTFDPERARALLHEAGYGPEHPLPTVTLSYNSSEGNKQIAEAVQAMWRTHLDLAAEIENQEWKVFLNSLETRDFQLARYGWIGDYPDPFTFLELFDSHNGNNRSGWSHSRYDELLRLANLRRDPPARLALLREAEQLFAEQLPAIPLYVSSRAELIKPYLRGHVLNYELRYMYKYWWIDARWYEGTPTTELPHGFPPVAVAMPNGGEGGN